MNKLVFKLFYFKHTFAILSLLCIVFLIGCEFKITGEAVKELPHEIAPNPVVYFCPREDCGKVLESYIESANSSVHCAFYDINLKNVINALGKKSKTADVKIVMDKSNYKGQIKGDGLRMNNEKQLMHNKFCSIDNSIVITGSFNPTDNDDYRNNNNIAVVHSNILARNYEDEFDELWDGNFGGGKNVKHPILYVNEMKIENYFCPEDCQSGASFSISKDRGLYKIIDLIKNAKESVKVASFTFTNEKIADELVKAQSRGINVTIITESKQRNVMGSQYQRMKDFGLNIKLDGNKYNMHHKFIVIDGKIVVTGSPNFTLSGFNANDENMLIIYDNEIADKYIKEFDALYSDAKNKT